MTENNSNFGYIGDNIEQHFTNPQILTAQNKKLNDLYESYNKLLEIIKRQDPEYASLITIDPLGIEEVQEHLKEDQTLISYFLTNEKSYAFVVSKSNLEVVELTIDLPRLDQNLENILPKLRQITAETSYKEDLAIFYNLLLRPITEANLLNTKELIIVPHGKLHFVPFTALWDGEQYLGENYEVTYLPSASVLRFLNDKQKDNPNQQKLLSMAFNRAENQPLLSHANNEAEDIANLYRTVAFKGISSGTEENFRSEAEGKDIIHVAAHSILNDEFPLRTQIALAPSGETSETDGFVTVQDVYSIDLSAANLVVLSACDTAKGELSDGDDLVGLTRAFIYAGTPNIVATLWKVQDESAKILMTDFHQNIKEGMDYAEALREAQADLRANPEYAHPYHWAPFVLAGSGY